MRKVNALFIVLAAVFLIAAKASEPQWKQLYNGKDLTGWKHVGPGGMTVEDGLIKTHGGMGLLLDWVAESQRQRHRVFQGSCNSVVEVALPASGNYLAYSGRDS